MWGNNTDNTGLSADPDNMGFGFKVWTSSEDVPVGKDKFHCGFFTGAPEYVPTSTTPYPGNLFPYLTASDGSAFGMYGHTDTGAACYRQMRAPLMQNGYIRAFLGINYRNGSKGIRFVDNTVMPPVTAAAFFVSGNEYRAYTQTEGEDSIPHSYQPNSTFRVTVYKQETFTGKGIIEIKRIGSASDFTFISNIANDFNVDQLEFYVEDTDPPTFDPVQNNLYFNILTGYSAYR